MRNCFPDNTTITKYHIEELDERVVMLEQDSCYDPVEVTEHYPDTYPGGNTLIDTVHENLNKAAAYFQEVFDRDSFDDRFEDLIGAIWEGDEYEWNAGYHHNETNDWISFKGPREIHLGWADDVAAHEFTHGVTKYTANFAAYGQAGMLDEHFADAFAAMVDREDWLGAEDSGVVIRSMEDPPAYGQPDHMDGYVPDTSRHYNIGIPNKALYLLSEGGTHYGIEVQGIGRNATEGIWYYALENLIESSDFIDFAYQIIRASEQLYPGQDDYHAAARNALTSVGILDDEGSLIFDDVPFATQNSIIYVLSSNTDVLPEYAELAISTENHMADCHDSWWDNSANIPLIDRLSGTEYEFWNSETEYEVLADGLSADTTYYACIRYRASLTNEWTYGHSTEARTLPAEPFEGEFELGEGPFPRYENGSVIEGRVSDDGELPYLVEYAYSTSAHFNSFNNNYEAWFSDSETSLSTFDSHLRFPSFYDPGAIFDFRMFELTEGIEYAFMLRQNTTSNNSWSYSEPIYFTHLPIAEGSSIELVRLFAGTSWITAEFLVAPEGRPSRFKLQYSTEEFRTPGWGDRASEVYPIRDSEGTDWTNWEPGTLHWVNITDLTPGVTYYFSGRYYGWEAHWNLTNRHELLLPEHPSPPDDDRECFSGETLITLIDGETKALKDLKPGDQVLSWDLESNTEASGKITKLHKREVDEYLIINSKTKVTKEHPFYISGSWVPAKELKVGDKLKGTKGAIEIKSIEKVSEPLVVFNLTVDKHNNYFANDALVHNKGGMLFEDWLNGR